MKNKFLNEIESASRIAILGHIRPDGDCVGSTLGLYNYIKDNYDKTVCVYLEDFSKDFMFINGAELVRHQLDSEKYDLCIGVDCGDTDRFGDFIMYFNEAPRTMCVDHHISNKGFGNVCYVDKEACSAAEAIFKLIEVDKLSKNAAESLYMGIVHDTGVFKHSNTTRNAMEVAGILIEKGARPNFVIDETFYKKTFYANKLLGRALSKAQLFADGKIICSVLSIEDFMDCNAAKVDTDGIVDQLRITEGIETAVFVYENDKDNYKFSLRSNNIVNVSEIAVSHGGGGHIRAAGFSLKGNIEDLLDIIISDIKKQL